MIAAVSFAFVSIDTSSAAITDSAKSTVKIGAQQWISPSLEVFPADYKSVTVSWAKAGSYTSYILQYSSSSNFASATSQTVNGLSATISGLSAETNYYFRVRAVDAPNATAWTSVASAETPPQAPTTQALFHATPDPHGASLDSKGNVWISDFAEGSVRKITPAGVSSLVAQTPTKSYPRGLSVVNDTTAVYIQSYNNADVPEAGLYTVNSSGEMIQRVHFYRPYGVVYDSKRNQVFVSHENYISKCDYITWKCEIALEQAKGTTISHINITPDKSKIVMSGGNSYVLSTLEIDSGQYSVLVNSTNLDVRGSIAIGNNDYLATSWTKGDVYRIRLDPTSGAVSTQTIINGGTNPRTMAYESKLQILYLGMNGPTKGLYKYENVIRD